LERRLRGNGNSGPVINFNIPNEVVQLFRPAAPAVPPTIPAPAPALAPALHINLPADSLDSVSLIPADRIPGPEFSLDEFCLKYNVTDRVRNKLDENGYSGSHTFQYAAWNDLKEAGLKTGELAQVKHALLRWTLPRVN